MASSPLRADSACIKHFAPVPPAAISRVLSRFDRDQLAGFIAVAIDLLDLADGDPDLELVDEREPDGDGADVGWPEWDQRHPNDKRAEFEMPNPAAGWGFHAMTEDDELTGDEMDAAWLEFSESNRVICGYLDREDDEEDDFGEEDAAGCPNGDGCI